MTQRYIGTKIVDATPMNRLDYNEYRGWELPSNEDGADEGYLVEYVDGGKANDSRHASYISWSPKDVFERAYHPYDGTQVDKHVLLQQGLTKLAYWEPGNVQAMRDFARELLASL